MNNNKKHIFLVEIGTEELPGSELRLLAVNFSKCIEHEFNNLCVLYDTILWYATPRRLAVEVQGVDKYQQTREICKRGPKVIDAFDLAGNPTKSMLSWIKCYNININKIEYFTNNKGVSWVIYKFFIKGKLVRLLLYDIVLSALNKLPIKKIMRWDGNNITTKFIRPVHNVTLLLDDKIITGVILGKVIKRIVYGHRFMGQSVIRLSHAANYSKFLLEYGKVIVNYKNRKENILENIQKKAIEVNGFIDIDEIFLDELTSLVEWPIVLIGKFDVKFLVIPKELLICIMQKYQKYCAVYNKEGNLLPYFIFVINIDSEDIQRIIIDNEKVLCSRLEDAKFLLTQDIKKCKLIDRFSNLTEILFYKSLGNLQEKSYRISAIASNIAHLIGENVEYAGRAGLLSKCDLITQVVSEFNDMKGIMGMYYAQYDGEEEVVCLAQKEQYYPRFSKDIIPTNLISCAVSIADKIDTLTGLLGMGKTPQGDSDPYGLRRMAIGILRIILEKKLSLDLVILVKQSIDLYAIKEWNPLLIDIIIKFILDRFYFIYNDINKEYKKNIITSVLLCYSTIPLDCDARIKVIYDFYVLQKLNNLIILNKRISHILRGHDNIILSKINTELLCEEEEIILYNIYINIFNNIKKFSTLKLYKYILMELIKLYEPVDRFFSKIIVMSENIDIRINRLTLLNKIKSLFFIIADFSVL